MTAPKRQNIGKKLRFEVFKRDWFTCQYCGASPPQVLLQIDHIHPVKEGGDNSIDNLVAACQSCNLGKGARLLGAIPEDLKAKAERIAEQEAQLAGYQAIISAKRERLEQETEFALGRYIERYDGIRLDYWNSARLFVEKLDVFTVSDAMDIALEWGHWKSDNKVFKYFCGVCWRQIKAIEESVSG